MFYWLIYAGISLYMELVFHLGRYGRLPWNPLFTLGLIALLASVQALIDGIQPKKRQIMVFWVLILPEYLLFAAQAVYLKIFKQPLQIGMALATGQDALANFWREALQGVIDTIPLLLLLALPLIVCAVLQKRKKWPARRLQKIQCLRVVLTACGSLFYCVSCITIGSAMGTVYAESYIEFYDPDTVIGSMGVLPMIQRDGWYEIQNLIAGLSRPRPGKTPIYTPVPDGWTEASESLPSRTPGADTPQNTAAPEDQNQPGDANDRTLDTSPNARNLDMAQLSALSQGGRETEWLAEYIAGLTPTNRNKYTGMFKGYNLIYLTAESFSTYAIREDLTPTLYKMANSSFVFTNYYVPLWQTSTSDGEYVNCTGLIPDGQHSMRKSASINMPFTLPRFFAKDGAYSWAYHNNMMDYYDRHRSHPNLGYDFKGSKLGDLSEEEWGDKIFPMDYPAYWPSSDWEMMRGTLPDYIDSDRFHAYYMTVSGHLNYTFDSNRMSARNRDAVSELEMSENAQAYIACHIELDKALAYLVEQLELAGKLDTTVFCLSADHYPYSMSDKQYEELAGKDLSGDMDLYRNTLILWNSAMEEPVIVDKACCSVDILPTLLNLFGFDFDSRMYAGRDIFSEEEGLVIFNDRSFVSDTVICNRKQNTTTWLTDLAPEEQEAYMKAKSQDVKDRYQFSAYILRNDYYDIVSRCIAP